MGGVGARRWRVPRGAGETEARGWGLPTYCTLAWDCDIVKIFYLWVIIRMG